MLEKVPLKINNLSNVFTRVLQIQLKMSYTTSVLSKITPDDILKLNYKEALMLLGGVTDLSQQKANQFSAKISLLTEHVKHLKMSQGLEFQRRVNQIKNKYCSNRPIRNFPRKNKKVAKLVSQQSSKKIQEQSIQTLPSNIEQSLKFESRQVKKQNQSKKDQNMLIQQKPSFFKRIIMTFFQAEKSDRLSKTPQEQTFTQNVWIPRIILPHEQQEEQLLGFGYPLSNADFGKHVKKEDSKWDKQDLGKYD